MYSTQSRPKFDIITKWTLEKQEKGREKDVSPKSIKLNDVAHIDLGIKQSIPICSDGSKHCRGSAYYLNSSRVHSSTSHLIWWFLILSRFSITYRIRCGIYLRHRKILYRIYQSRFQRCSLFLLLSGKWYWFWCVNAVRCSYTIIRYSVDEAKHTHTHATCSRWLFARETIASGPYDDVYAFHFIKFLIHDKSTWTKSAKINYFWRKKFVISKMGSF